MQREMTGTQEVVAQVRRMTMTEMEELLPQVNIMILVMETTALSWVQKLMMKGENIVVLR